MINRLHADGGTRASVEYPSFDEDFAGESRDDLREEFLNLLDQVASTAQRSTRADEAISASIAAAASLARTPERQVELSRANESKAPVVDTGDLLVKRGGGACEDSICVSDQSLESDYSNEQSVVAQGVKGQGAVTSTPREDKARVSAPGENEEVTVEKTDSSKPTEEDSDAAVAINAEGSSDSDTAVSVMVDVVSDTPIPLSADPVLSDAPEQVVEQLETSSIEDLSVVPNAAKIAEIHPESSTEESSAVAVSAELRSAVAGESVDDRSNIATDGAIVAPTTPQVSEEVSVPVAIPEFEPPSPDLLFRPTAKVDAGVAAGVATTFLGRPDAAIKFALLKETFEHLKGSVADSKSAHASSSAAHQQTSGTTPAQQNAPFIDGNVGNRSSQGVLKESSRPLPKGLAVRTLDRVESAIKEAAKSRDGKTLSFRLDPPQLGQVKVDVTLKEGALHARIVPENSQVATLLRERAPELQSTLRRLGLNVETVTVSVGSENAAVSNGGADNSSDGKSFHHGRNKMPGQGDQVVETTFGNEIALHGEAMVVRKDDHWVA